MVTGKNWVIATALSKTYLQLQNKAYTNHADFTRQALQALCH